MSVLNAHPPAPPKRAKRRTFRVGALILGALVLGGTAAGGMTVIAPAPAVAIDNYHGAGINWGNGVHMNGAGNYFLPDGSIVYCAELFVFTDPSSAIPTYTPSSTIPAKSDGGITVYETSGAAVEAIAYVISKYGQTTDNEQAAATALAIWSLRSGNAGYDNQLNIIRTSVGAGVTALAQAYMNEANAWVAAGGGSGDVWVNDNITTTAPYVGTIAIPGGVTSMTITNGVWADGSTTMTWPSGAPAGTVLSWQGVPPSSDKWDKYYRVSFNGRQYQPAREISFGDGAGWQSSIKTAPPRERTLDTIYVDPDTSWAPTVSSSVASKFISVGEEFTDTITFGTMPAQPGRTDQWRWRLAADGTREWMPIKATATVYGPFLSDPALNPSAEAPVGAPVAARLEFTTINDDGSFLQANPVGQSNPVSSTVHGNGETAQEQGYYTFKWDIVGDDQHESVTGVDDCVSPDRVAGCRVFPTNYFYTDGFGTTGETQAAKMPANFSTQLSTDTLALGAGFTDAINIPAMQNWLRDNTGARHTMTLTGTMYLVPGLPGSPLVQSAEVPADAIPVGTTRVVTDPAQNGQTVTSSELTLPVSTQRDAQYVTMRWCVVNADQEPQSVGIWEERCDDFGVPAESAKIVRPTVTTEAQLLATKYDEITDTAIVNGPVPSSTTVRFNLYKKVVAGDAKRNADGSKSDVLWTQAEIDAMGASAVCVAENLVTTTTGIPVDAGMNDSKRYVSPKVVPGDNGTFWWIEELVTVDPDTGTEVVIDEGECGLPNETTTVTEPKVTTKATPAVYVGEKARDTAIVDGPIPGPESGVETVLTFEAFEKTGDKAVCTPENRVHNLTTPIVVTGAGEYQSAEVTFEKVGSYFWQETLKYIITHLDGSKTEIVVHTGECGLPNETTVVKAKPVLALTGATGELNAFGWGGIAALGLLLAGGAVFAVARIRQRQDAPVELVDAVRDCEG